MSPVVPQSTKDPVTIPGRAGPADQHDGVRAGGHGAGNLVEMHLHGFGIGSRHEDRSRPWRCFGQIAPKIYAEAVRWSLGPGAVFRAAHGGQIILGLAATGSQSP